MLYTVIYTRKNGKIGDGGSVFAKVTHPSFGERVAEVTQERLEMINFYVFDHRPSTVRLTFSPPINGFGRSFSYPK